MPLNDIKGKHVRAAIRECNERGELKFLEQYGFDWARRFLLVHRSRYYQSKAILGVAHAYAAAGNKALRPNEFSGGDKHQWGAARVLCALGFDVVDRPHDDWPLWMQLGGAAGTLHSHFPRWKSWSARFEFDELAWPGVYVIGVFKTTPPRRVFPLPRELVYVGQTTRTLRERLDEFHSSASGGSRHSGGCTFFETIPRLSLRKAWVSVLPVRLPPGEQPGAITLLEGLLIWSYSQRWRRSPSCNTK